MSRYPRLTPEEAAQLINNDDMVAFSGFTPAGSPKAVPLALANRALEFHSRSVEFKIKLISGASISSKVDNLLADANCIKWRAPYQSAPALRNKINHNEIEFVDMHLSEVTQMIKYGFFGDIDIAVVEAVDVTDDGRVFLSSSIGNTPIFLQTAKKIIIERNSYHSQRVSEFADIVTLPNPPKRPSILLNHPMDRLGKTFVQVDPAKIVGIVETNQAEDIKDFNPGDEMCEKIASNVVKFLLNEMASGRIPKEFLPVQSGVGNINNSVMNLMGHHAEIPPFYMYSEVLQESVVDMLSEGKILGVSASSLTITSEKLQQLYNNMDFFADKIVLRPQEISNSPEIARRLGVIALNVGLEFDIYGHANSSHTFGTELMNGIGGSGDFTRNAYLSIFMAPSIAKGGKISSIVPMCTHVDHNEHSVKVIITDQGIADLRGLSPMQRAQTIIENCAHPMYRDYLFNYLKNSRGGHLHHDLGHAFDLHQQFLATGSMLPA